jgi:NACHT domain
VLTLFTSSSIIEKIHDMRQMGLAMVSFFYFDFRDHGKQEVRHLLSSILIQLCDQSDKFSEILSTLFENHSRGSRQPSEEALVDCLKKMLTLPAHGALYLIIDALDECPNSSGYPTQRQEVLNVMEALINLQLPHVHLCITSRPEVDIRAVLEPLAIYNVRLHEQAGQNQDIVDYINYFLQSDSSVRRWRAEDKQLIIETLMEKASGM